MHLIDFKRIYQLLTFLKSAKNSSLFAKS